LRRSLRTGAAYFISGFDIEIKVYEIIFFNVHVIFEKEGFVKKARKSNITGSADPGN
jgi:hypothetical protein